MIVWLLTIYNNSDEISEVFSSDEIATKWLYSYVNNRALDISVDDYEFEFQEDSIERTNECMELFNEWYKIEKTAVDPEFK